MVVLESAESVERRGSEPYAKITGVGRTTDAYNLTDPDPKGSASCGPCNSPSPTLDWREQIGYINPHGTGTVAGDGPESQAMAKINPDVRVSATKSTLGHSLGASGAVETAIPRLAMEEKDPPDGNLTKVAEGCAELDYVVDEPREAPDLEAALCANLGVGGHTQRSSWSGPNEQPGERIRGSRGSTRAGRRRRLRPPARYADAFRGPEVHGGRLRGPLDPDGDDRRLLLPAYREA